MTRAGRQGIKENKAQDDFCLEAYDYDLPEKMIAQTPVMNRDESRLMVVDSRRGRLESLKFNNILRCLPKRALIVVNNSKVVPGRIRALIEHGGNLELLVMTPLTLLLRDVTILESRATVTANVLVRPSKKIRLGVQYTFGELQATILEKEEFGQARALLTWNADRSLEEIMQAWGEVPLPPYIQRTPDQADQERYQTVYASNAEKGSIAAPTAGLHFTPELKERLILAGHEWVELTLYVGYGTFSPIRCKDIREHRMHAEFVKVSSRAAERVALAKREGRAVIAVGTTCLRTLEGVAAIRGIVEPYEGWLDTYIYPGFDFKVVDGLITNFHLPKSSLLVLVSAFAGREQILAAYRRAVGEGYRFFSYGDAMFIKP